MSYTKGPWFVDSDALDSCYIAAEHEQGNMPIASMLVDSGLMQGNARLIAAAPELLEALENALRIIEQYKPLIDSWSDEDDNDHGNVIRIIAKAKGINGLF